MSWIKAFGKGNEVDDESLALDVIAEAGPGQEQTPGDCQERQDRMTKMRL